MPSIESLKKRYSFTQVYNHRRSVANRLLVLYIKESSYNESRFGISISRKVGGAVVRNRIKRLIREQIRLHIKDIAIGFDMVIVVRTAATLPKDVAFKKIGQALLDLLDRQNVLIRHC